jgi:uncharacterized membrane protein
MDLLLVYSVVFAFISGIITFIVLVLLPKSKEQHEEEQQKEEESKLKNNDSFDKTSNLVKISKMYNNGLISEEEFTKLKKNHLKSKFKL